MAKKKKTEVQDAFDENAEDFKETFEAFEESLVETFEEPAQAPSLEPDPSIPSRYRKFKN